MHRWYVKAKDQTNHEARAAVLGCAYVLESTSAQVDPASPLPHVIIQTRLGVNHVFPEPVSIHMVNAIKDEAKSADEMAAEAQGMIREAARGRLMASTPQAILDPNARAIIADILTHLGLAP